MKLRVFLISVLALGYFIIAISPAAGTTTRDGPEKLKESVVAKTVTGMVSGVSSNFIAVEYGVSGENGPALEMAFDVTKDVKISNRRSMKEIKMGDTVSVDYVEITQTKVNGERVSKRNVAKIISFVKPAPREVRSEVLGAGNE